MRPVFHARQSASIQMKDFQASPVNGTPPAGDNTGF
jgi:hypothetical protein